MSKLYAYTARFLKKKYEEPEEPEIMYQPMFDHLHKCGYETTVRYEPDYQRHDMCHVHGTIRIPNDVYRKQIISDLKEKRFYFFLKNITNQYGWEEYINKHQK